MPVTGPSAQEPASHGRAESVQRSLPAHFREKSPLVDTAGVPWKGRDYSVSPFPNDDGSAPLALAAAIHAVRAVSVGEAHDGAAVRAERLTDLAGVLRGARLLVPIMAVATEEGTTAHGLTGDNGADMAMVTIRGADGSSALPVFSAVDELSAWRRDARPVPVIAEKAAQAAVQEGCTALLLDPAAHEEPVVLQRSLLWALARGRPWVHPATDPAVTAELARLAAEVDGVLALEPRAGTVREVDLVVRLRPALPAEQVQRIVARLSAALGASQIVAERITSLKLVLEA